MGALCQEQQHTLDSVLLLHSTTCEACLSQTSHRQVAGAGAGGRNGAVVNVASHVLFGAGSTPRHSVQHCRPQAVCVLDSTGSAHE